MEKLIQSGLPNTLLREHFQLGHNRQKKQNLRQSHHAGRHPMKNLSPVDPVFGVPKIFLQHFGNIKGNLIIFIQLL